MKSPLTDLQKLNRLFSDLENDLSADLQNSAAGGKNSLADSILKKKPRLVQIGSTYVQIQTLSEDLKRSHENYDTKTRQEADKLFQEIKSSALHMQDLCSQISEELETTKSAVRKELEEIGKGKQYLKSVHPVKNNYPKFFDSTG